MHSFQHPCEADLVQKIAPRMVTWSSPATVWEHHGAVITLTIRGSHPWPVDRRYSDAPGAETWLTNISLLLQEGFSAPYVRAKIGDSTPLCPLHETPRKL